MKFKIICCDVLENEIKYALSESKHTYEIEFTKKAEHEKPEEMRLKLQTMVDQSDGFDAILLGYGLCGNAITGIRSQNTTMVVPRAHDCCTLFLGSRDKFSAIFDGRESMGWGSTGYCRKDGDYLRNSETGSILGYDKSFEDFVAEYGKENAEFIWATIHPVRESNEVMFIDIPETFEQKVFEEFKKEATKSKQDVFVEKGSIELIKKFMDANWDDDFLVIEPGYEIAAAYTSNEIIKAIG